MKRLSLFFSILLSGCGNQNLASVDPNVVIEPNFSSISKNIFNNSCINCHGGAGGYSFNSYENTVKAVSPGDPDSSPLYSAVSSGRMPRVGTMLSLQQIQAIKDWISNGAKND